MNSLLAQISQGWLAKQPACAAGVGYCGSGAVQPWPSLLVLMAALWDGSLLPWLAGGCWPSVSEQPGQISSPAACISPRRSLFPVAGSEGLFFDLGLLGVGVGKLRLGREKAERAAPRMVPPSRSRTRALRCRGVRCP